MAPPRVLVRPHRSTLARRAQTRNPRARHEPGSCPGGLVRRDLPSLSALRAFEAAARHESITRGAVELGVTQAAVSHQVRALEDELGLRLFRRLPRRLALTPEGD